MRKNTPVYCRLNLYENLRELMRIKSNTFCLYERKKKKSIKVFYNNNFDKVCVVPCCLFLDCFLNCRLQPKRPLCASCFHVRLNSNANITNIAYILGNIGSYHKTELWLKKQKQNMNFTFLSTKSHSKLLGVLCAITERNQLISPSAVITWRDSDQDKYFIQNSVYCGKMLWLLYLQSCHRWVRCCSECRFILCQHSFCQCSVDLMQWFMIFCIIFCGDHKA